MAKKKRMPQAEYDAAIDLLLHLRARFPNVISRLNQQYGRRPRRSISATTSRPCFLK
jgi:hypothetical protein